MLSANVIPPLPANEPQLPYGPGSAEKASLKAELDAIAGETIVAPCVIGGREVETGETFGFHAPHDHDLHLADVHGARSEDISGAIDAALAAKYDWANASFEERAAVILKAADLISGPYRDTLNAATMLGQSKNVWQAEIDAACELIDFLRFNVHYAAEIRGDQPLNDHGTWNIMDYRPLEGFVLAITPFNFTAIAGNLPTAPALMGNTVVWKPSEKQALSAHYFMRILREAGLPDGVINLVHGDGALAAQVAMEHPDFAGLHFTGSVTVFEDLWERAASHIKVHRTFPRIVGETGGKDFVAVHPSADVDQVTTALVRGAFEYQGQKCSAASRAYLPSSRWEDLRDRLVDVTGSLQMGDPRDFRNFLCAVIDGRAFNKHREAIEEARQHPDCDVIVGGGTDDSVGWFVEPTIITTTDPTYRSMTEELFGPILTVHVYDDERWDETLDLVDSTSPFALTGAVFATDREIISQASRRLRHAAGNFYVNDKPTGSIVGQQPFGGSRKSGTNDKAGSMLNLLRWTSARVIKETFVAPTDHTYPHMREA
jgi:1-pyrroline-5-carboxylate dehydrogenase